MQWKFSMHAFRRRGDAIEGHKSLKSTGEVRVLFIIFAIIVHSDKHVNPYEHGNSSNVEAAIRLLGWLTFQATIRIVKSIAHNGGTRVERLHLCRCGTLSHPLSSLYGKCQML